MVADVILTVAVITAAAGTVTELKVGVADIGSAANSTPMGVRGFGCSGGCLIGTGIEGNCFMLGVGCSIPCPFGSAAGIDSPGLGQHIQHIRTKEQEIVGKGNDTEEIDGEGSGEKVQSNDGQIKQGEDPGFHRDDKEKKKMGIGIHGGISEEHAQIQVGDIGLSTKDQTPYIHHHHAGEIKQIEFQSTPGVFHGPAQRPVAEQGNGNEQQITVAGAVDQGKSDKSPDLAVNNGLPVEAQQGIQTVVAGHLTHQINNSGTCSNVEHQVGNALVTVGVAESLKAAAKVFQGTFTPKFDFVYFNRKG